MTPNNIFNMASIKKLNIIAVTDHNSLKQCPICRELSESYDMLYIPGVEVTVEEGFDVLIYFKSFKDAMAFDKVLERYIPKKMVDTYKYNEQTVCDIDDEPESTFPYLLAQPLHLSFELLLLKLRSYEHLIFFAHVDRYEEKVEYWIKSHPCHGTEYKHREVFPYQKQLFNSDAHQIVDILERYKKNSIDLESLTIDHFFRYFQHG